MNNYFTVGTAWGILPDKLESKHEQFLKLSCDSEVLTKSITFQAVPTTLKTILKDIAVIDIKGSIVNDQSFINYLMNDAILPDIKQQLQQAVSSKKIKSIILNIDSPGGVVDGTYELADYIASIEKPVIAYASGCVCSSAYLLASAANEIYITPSTDAGSIGVLLIHKDFSEYEKQEGIKTTVLTAGKYKGLGNPYEPLNTTAKETFQERLDYIYSMFVDTVAKYRNKDVKEVLNMADGKVFIGKQAVDAGLVDGIATMNDVLNNTLLGKSSIEFYNNEGEKPKGKTKMSDYSSVEELKDAFPDLTKALFDEGAKSVDVETQVSYETARVLNLVKAHFGAEGEKFENIVKTGVTLDQYEAIKAIQPESKTETKDIKAEILNELHKDSIDVETNVKASNEFDSFDQAWKSFKQEGLDTKAAMSKASSMFPELYEKFLNGGK